MSSVQFNILNQLQTPAFYADVIGNRPAAGFVGRVFISTDTFLIYRDNGATWDQIGGSTGNFVPYTGATQTVDLGTRQLKAGITTLSSRLNVAGAADNALYQLNVNGVSFFNGNLNLIKSSGDVLFALSAVSTAAVVLRLQTAGVNKWGFGRGTATGSDNFELYNYSIGANNLIIDITTGVASFKYGLRSDQVGTGSAFVAANATANFQLYFDTGSTAQLLNSSGGYAFRNTTNNANLIEITTGGVLNGSSRFNVNGATDNSIFALNVNGTINGSSQSFTGNTYTVTGNLSQQFYHVFTGAVGQTLTAPTPSGNNSQYLIVNNSANVLTVAAFSGTNIITTLGATSATITLAANARTLLIADGNNKYYQAF